MGSVLITRSLNPGTSALPFPLHSTPSAPSPPLPGTQPPAPRTHNPHPSASLQVLGALHAQLEVSLSPDSSSQGVGNGGGSSQVHPFGVPMVEELLPDSFLRHALGSFFHMLQVGAGGG